MKRVFGASGSIDNLAPADVYFGRAKSSVIVASAVIFVVASAAIFLFWVGV